MYSAHGLAGLADPDDDLLEFVRYECFGTVLKVACEELFLAIHHLGQSLLQLVRQQRMILIARTIQKFFNIATITLSLSMRLHHATYDRH